ncbi:helix-turn-helix domain-containing protein [Lacticaseibacillus camelliae]|uniref:helix-turn-helix domain-containing protein n=1 Tax=Lacticaseibacillus camelliae TaxID=381742 RepID=UPI0006D1603A|nr:helix-turn-helix transcriptional regulator [Lacticaseibacillus camelliae]
MTAKTTKISDMIDENLKNPEFKEEYEKQMALLESAAAIMQAREAAGVTQRELAQRSGVPQATIARIERGANTSVATMTKIAMALGKKSKD